MSRNCQTLFSSRYIFGQYGQSILFALFKMYIAETLKGASIEAPFVMSQYKKHHTGQNRKHTEIEQRKLYDI